MFKRSISLLTTFLSVTAILVIFQNFDAIEFSPTVKIEESNQRTKNILYWNPMFDNPDFYMGHGSEIFKDCASNTCFATSNKSYLPNDRFDAILFHGYQYNKSHGKPPKRSPHQMYVFVNLESPDNSPLSIKNYNDFYNWTMTYRIDSDVFRPYDYIRTQKTDYQLPTVQEIEKRPKKIAWMVSDCTTKSEREKLVREINKHIPVDVYGKCGKLKCLKKDKNKCYKMIEENYKFYLSFENSICEDYVTEKLFNVLQLNIIPVVYGGANYENFAPFGSYINVSNFTSVKALIDYLKYLDTHTKKYLNFFKWKKYYVSDTSGINNRCGLCRKLNEPIEAKSYSDISGWWFGKKKKQCSDELITKKLLLN